MNRDSAVPPFTALRRRCSYLRGQAGFALTEVIAAAAVLAFLALGVLAGLDGAASSTGREKARSVASGLAERDQERLHSIPAVDLPDLRELTKENVGGIEYTIVSEVDWVSDTTGGTISCTSNAGKADYLRLRSTVTSDTVGKRTIPAKIESLIAPPVGSAGGNNGTLAIQVNNRDKTGQKNITVQISGKAGGHVETQITNDLGCAVFAMIPGDTYDVLIQEPQWVDPSGTNKIEKTAIVSPGTTTVDSLLYDIRAQVTTGFNTRFYNNKTSAWVTQAGRAWALSLENADVPGSGVRTFADTSGAVDPLTVQTATNLFPFSDGYGIYAGKCTEENPASYDTLHSWAELNAFQASERNTVYDRTTGAATPLRMPALPIRIHKDWVTTGVHTGKPAWFGNANVVARLVVPEPAPGEPPLCSDTIDSVTGNTTWGLQSYPTSGTGRTLTGTSANNYDDGMAGFVTKKPGAGGTEFDPGLPFGKWQLCIDDYNNDNKRRVFFTIENNVPDGSTTITAVNLGPIGATLPGSTAQAGRRCSDATGWPVP